MPNSFGVIVEGSFDAAVFEELIRKITNPQVKVIVRDCGGIGNLKRLFPVLLRDLENSLRGGPVAKALVLCDADEKEPGDVEAALARRIEGEHYSFPDGIQFYAVRRKLETILLADESAVNSVRRSRGRGRDVTALRENLEDLANPKERFKAMLSDAGLDHTPRVCAQIVEVAQPDKIADRCPYFGELVRRIHDC